MQQGERLWQLTLPEGWGGSSGGASPCAGLEGRVGTGGRRRREKVCQEVGLVTQRSARAWHVGELQEQGSVSLGAEVWGLRRQEGERDQWGVVGSP